MKAPYFILFVFLPFFGSGQAGSFIHIDQFGYKAQAEKVAVLSDPQVGYNATGPGYSPSASVVLKDAITNQTVFTAAPQLWNNGNTHTNSGDKGWWFDFSSFQKPGEYYVMDTAKNERSHTFLINENPYEKVLKDAGRIFFYNRCNSAKLAPYAGAKWTDGMNFMNTHQDGSCRLIHDSLNLAPIKDLSGGWFDAGDYNKYVTFAYTAVHDLLYAFEENPDAFGDDWNIPESGNGIPDIIDEIKWETDWLLKMVDSNGRTPIKMGSRNYNENISNPPSANTDPRYYGPDCTSASIAAASVLAHAGVVMKQFPSLQPYVDSLGFKAKAAADYVRPLYFSNSLEYNCDDGSIISGDADRDSSDQADMLLTASVYLWELLLDANSKSFVDFNYFVFSAHINYGYSAYNAPLLDAMVRYAKHPANQGSNASVGIMNNIDLMVNNNWSDYFSWNDNDLYRAPVPDWTYHWGSNQIIARYGNMNNLLAHYNVALDSVNQRKRGAETLHYFHGINPNGLVYLSNMYDAGGDHCINEIYHTWFADGSIYDHALNSSNGPPPGFLVGGANEYFSVATLTPPYGQPKQKAYLDFNTSWPQNSWEISEPAIYYQAAYIRLLSKYVNKSAIPTDAVHTNSQPLLSVYPNPTSDMIFIKGVKNKVLAQTFDLNGRLVNESNLNIDNHTLTFKELPPSYYILKLSTADDSQEFKILKK